MRKIEVNVVDESDELKSSMLSMGWHNNYVDFETADGRKGNLVFYGETIFLEFDKYDKKGNRSDKGRRFKIKMKDLIVQLMGKK